MTAVIGDEDMFKDAGAKEEEEESEETKLQPAPTAPEWLQSTSTVSAPVEIAVSASKPDFFKAMPPAPPKKLPILQCVLIGCKELAEDAICPKDGLPIRRRAARNIFTCLREAVSWLAQ